MFYKFECMRRSTQMQVVSFYGPAVLGRTSHDPDECAQRCGMESAGVATRRRTSH